jgi:hypothetical protein
MNQAATLKINTGVATASGSKRHFLRHFGEMVLAMFAGMVVLGGLAAAAFAVAGSSMTHASGAAQVVMMGLSMTLPMVGWMAYRGHDRSRNAEMAASMILPTLAAAALAMTGALESEAALSLQHAVMIPAMLGVMLWRYEHYSGAHE